MDYIDTNTLDRLQIIMDTLADQHQTLTALVDNVSFLVGRKRTDFSEATKRVTVRFMWETDILMCPCCGMVQVVSKSELRLPGAQFDHICGPSDNSLENCWLVCAKCNRKLRDAVFRMENKACHEHFQLRLSRWLDQQIPVGARGDPRQHPLFETLPRIALEFD